MLDVSSDHLPSYLLLDAEALFRRGSVLDRGAEGREDVVQARLHVVLFWNVVLQLVALDLERKPRIRHIRVSEPKLNLKSQRVNEKKKKRKDFQYQKHRR